MKKILLIEDNLEMRENTAEILEFADYEVVTAENGKIGVEKAKVEKPDLIICDIMMPELDGYGVLYLLGKNMETASIPFIFLTAKADRADMRKGMNLGADDYLTKPYEEMELLNAVESRLKKSEIVRREFEKNAKGLSNFLEEAGTLSELEDLSKDRKLRTYKKKETVFYEGDYPHGIFFINHGKVKTAKMNEDGKEYITGIFSEGDFFGFMPVLEDKNYTDFAIAMEETELSIIPREDFLQLVFNNRDVATKFIKMLSNNVQENEERLLNLAYNSVRKRVADALILLLKRNKEKDPENSIVITREDLAGIVGTATESVIRTLSDFKEENLIEVKGSKIRITKPDKLANLRW